MSPEANGDGLIPSPEVLDDIVVGAESADTSTQEIIASDHDRDGREPKVPFSPVNQFPGINDRPARYLVHLGTTQRQGEK